ncbi:MAG: PTS sugar transporter subunit IIA [Gemmatimonadales bacterium]|jgi:PTS system nitrogen regulatory IIA component|nr:MAG: PTS sugar transporter subunit IIA [Gemmatimonadales bacterium]
MHLREFFAPDAVRLPLAATTKEEALAEMVGLLHVDQKSTDTLLKMLHRRETLGSTGVGRGVAVPHCRSLVVSRLQLAYGYSPAGLAFDAADGQPVHHVFLIVAPPNEMSNQYLPTLGKIAQLAKEPGVREQLAEVGSAEEFFQLLADKGV